MNRGAKKIGGGWGRFQFPGKEIVPGGKKGSDVCCAPKKRGGAFFVGIHLKKGKNYERQIKQEKEGEGGPIREKDGVFISGVKILQIKKTNQ